MKAAIVNARGNGPIYGDFAEPLAGEGEEIVETLAVALNPVTRSRAAGTHYSAAGDYPLVPGIDGVGRRADGSRVYFVMPKPPIGSLAERVAIDSRRCVALPDDLDDVTAAAIANPGMSSWAAYAWRARLQAGETVMVNGATGAAGRLAVQIAKHLGAGRVIATGRDRGLLAEVEALGADATILLEEDRDALEERLKEQFAQGIDVVIDYLWGPSAERLLIAAAKGGKDGVPIRFVQVGAASGAEIALPAAVLRASAIEMKGSGIGSIPLDRLQDTIRNLFEVTVKAGLKIATRTVPLADVEAAWAAKDGRKRTVFTMNPDKKG